MSDSRDLEMALLLSKTLDASRGTLWWVREDLWGQASGAIGAEFYASDRFGHPGLSLREQSPVTRYEVVPMLRGFSKCKPKSLWVTGVNGDSQRATYFDTLALLPINVDEFLRPAPDADKDELVVHPLQRSRVAVNWRKPRLSKTEMARMQAWLEGAYA